MSNRLSVCCLSACLSVRLVLSCLVLSQSGLVCPGALSCMSYLSDRVCLYVSMSVLLVISCLVLCVSVSCFCLALSFIVTAVHLTDCACLSALPCVSICLCLVLLFLVCLSYISGCLSCCLSLCRCVCLGVCL